MDVKELNKWIASEEGTAWLNEQKAPLLAKRDELLEALRLSNGKAAELAQRAADADRLLSEERAAVRKIVVDDVIAAELVSTVPEPIRAGIATAITNAYGVEVRADGLVRKAVGKLKGADGKEELAPMKKVVEAWRLTPDAKIFARAGMSSGGGATGGAGLGSGGKELSRADFDTMKTDEQASFIRSGGTVKE